MPQAQAPGCLRVPRYNYGATAVRWVTARFTVFTLRSLRSSDTREVSSIEITIRVPPLHSHTARHTVGRNDSRLRLLYLEFTVSGIVVPAKYPLADAVGLQGLFTIVPVP